MRTGPCLIIAGITALWASRWLPPTWALVQALAQALAGLVVQLVWAWRDTAEARRLAATHMAGRDIVRGLAQLPPELRFFTYRPRRRPLRIVGSLACIALPLGIAGLRGLPLPHATAIAFCLGLAGLHLHLRLASDDMAARLANRQAYAEFWAQVARRFSR